jgi:hypothetical protein
MAPRRGRWVISVTLVAIALVIVVLLYVIDVL